MTKYLRYILFICVLIGISVKIPALVQPAQAAGPWYVTEGGDDINDCLSPATPCATINAAVNKAASGDTVYVSIGTYIGSGDEVVAIEKNLTVSGGWDEGFSAQDGLSIIDGEEARTGIMIYSNYEVTIDRLNIQDCKPVYSQGAGIDVTTRGHLTINNSIINNSKGDGIKVWSYSTVILNNSEVKYSNEIGIRAINSTLELVNSSVIGSKDLGISSTSGTLTLIGSSIVDNNGGLYIDKATANLVNTTISGNGGSDTLKGGGIQTNWSGTVNLYSSTIRGNSAEAGGGIHNDSGVTITIQNSIIADNNAEASPDCHGVINSLGYNLFGDTTDCTLTLNTGDLAGVDPNLGSLIGFPPYHPLFSGSPAIDAGNPSDCVNHLGAILSDDQRGAPRVGLCDIGSYEYTVPGSADSIMVISGSPQRTPPNFELSTPLRAAVVDDIGSPIASVLVTFTAPDNGPSGKFVGTGTRSTTSITNASGITKADAFTANGLSGSYTVNASVTGVSVPAEFKLTNVAWYVSPAGNDANDCLSPSTTCLTINGALSKIEPGDTILVAEGTYTGVGDEVVLLNRSATLSGGWEETFTNQVALSIVEGENQRRGITVDFIDDQPGEVTATIDHFKLANGISTSILDTGGGIINYGNLTILDSEISDNFAGYGGAGISNYLDLHLDRSSIVDNQTDGMGGGIYNDRFTSIVLDNSTVSGNIARTSGGGIYNSNSGELYINNSTISGNQAGGDGISGSGGGIYHSGASVIQVSSSTISNNSAGGGGGISHHGDPSNSSVFLQNTILSGNAVNSGTPDCYWTIQSLGHNIIGDNSGCNFIRAVGDLLNVDPRIGPLEDNGGSTFTHELRLGSVAINHGNPSGCTNHLDDPLSSDQRGFPRVQNCDIGSYEFQQEVTQVFLPCVLNNYCRSVYSDDFSDPQSGWPEGDTSNVSFAYVSGEYRTLVKSSFWSIGVTSGFKATDSIIEVDVRNSSGVFGSYGLLFGISDDWNQFYLFDIDPDGYFSVYKFNTDTWTELAYDYSSAINTGTVSNRLKVIREGSSIKAYANGTLLTTVVDGSFTGSRRVGLATFSYDWPNVDARYDNFAVYPMTCVGAGTLAQNYFFSTDEINGVQGSWMSSQLHDWSSRDE